MLPFITCVLPTTSSRRWCLPRSIECWLKQDYPPERRRLIVLDGPNPDGERVEDLIVGHSAAINYIPLKPDAPATPGDKYNLGSSLALSDDWIALWADDDWHHPQRLSLVVDAMLKADVDVGGTISMFVYREQDKQLYLYLHGYTVEPFGMDGIREGDPQRIGASLPYFIGGTMIYKRSAWLAVEGFKPMERGTDSEFANRVALGCEPWDARRLQYEPQYGDNCAVISAVIERSDGVIYSKGFVQINEPRLYLAVVHGSNTGNPVAGAREGASVEENASFQKLGASEVKIVEKLLGDQADVFLRRVIV